MQDAANMIDLMNGVISSLQGEVAALKSQIPGHGGNKKSLIDNKALTQVPFFSGDEKTFTDFEFKLQQFVQPYQGFEETFDWIKDLESEPTLEVVRAKHEAENSDGLGNGVDMIYFNKEVYSILSMLCEGDALQTVKNLREDFHGRGFRAWYQLTREVAGKSGVRLERLADRVHKPKVITDYKLGHAMLTKWDAAQEHWRQLKEDLTANTRTCRVPKSRSVSLGSS